MNTNMFFLLVVVLAAVFPSSIVALATSDNNEDSSSEGSVCDETVAELTGVSFDRLNEVSDHLDDNKESLGLPDWMDSDIVKCNIVNNVVINEQDSGRIFEEEELNANLGLEILAQGNKVLDEFNK